MADYLFRVFIITFTLAACSSDAGLDILKEDLVFETVAGDFSISNLHAKVNKKNQLHLRGEVESEFPQIIDLRCFEIELSDDIRLQTGIVMKATRPYTQDKEFDFVKIDLESSSKSTKSITWGIGYKTKVRGLTTWESRDLFDVLVQNPNFLTIKYSKNCENKNFDSR